MGAVGTDFLQLDRATAPPRRLTDWLSDRLREAVIGGQLPPGATLPSSRHLATELGVSRGTVVDAYARLAEQGLLDARTGAGTRVVGPPAGAGPMTTAPSDQRPDRLPLRPDPHVSLDLAPGVPDLSAFPRAAWLRAERSVLADAGPADLGYGDVRGHPRLRSELTRWLARTRGIRAHPDDVLIVAGVAQSLALLAHVLRGRGVTGVAVEDPGSRGARDQLTSWGLTCVPVPVDDRGMRIDELRRTGASAAVLTPAHQFPTGVLLAPGRRRELLDWGRDGGLIVEDDYDAEHRYDRAPTPALHAAAPDLVVHTGSVSKTLAPGMRLGWLVAPAGLQADLIAARHAFDLGSPVFAQLVLAHLIASGELERHLRRTRTRQRVRRDALFAAVRRRLPDARIQGIAAGLHLTITLPGLTVPDTELAEQVLAAGVLVHPLSWHRHRPGPPGLVLGYAAHTPDRLRSAVDELAMAVDELSRAGSRSW